MEGLAYALGVLVLATLALVVMLANAGKGSNLLAMFNGADGRPSSSKFQFFLWTAVAIYAYIAVFFARLFLGHHEPLPDIPGSLLLAMGFSAIPLVTAKALTVQYNDTGKFAKTTAAQPNAPATTWAAIVQDDNGFVDLTKVQMIAWTFIAVAVYVGRTVALIHAGFLPSGAVPTLTDIDPALMVLSGLSQGTYLGKKLVTTTMPQVLTVSPSSGVPPVAVTLAGSGFGATQNAGGGLVTVNGKTNQAIVPTLWSETSITFPLPPLPPKSVVRFGVVVGGQQSNQVKFTVQ